MDSKALFTLMPFLVIMVVIRKTALSNIFSTLGAFFFKIRFLAFRLPISTSSAAVTVNREVITDSPVPAAKL